MKEILKFELFYKLWNGVIMLPCLSLFTGWFLRYVIGETILYNFDIVWELLSIPGILFIFCYGIVMLACVYFEYIVICKLIVAWQQNKKVNWIQIAGSSIKDLKALKSFSLPFLFIYYVLLNPLWHCGFVSSFLPRISIPSFITNELLKMDYGSILVIAIYLFLFILYGLLIFVPLYMIYQKASFWNACKKSV